MLNSYTTCSRIDVAREEPFSLSGFELRVGKVISFTFLFCVLKCKRQRRSSVKSASCSFATEMSNYTC